MRIAYQGVIGAYSEAAALRFNDSADLLSCPSFEDVFKAVDGGLATHGILPIENTIGGTIHRNYDLLLEHEDFQTATDDDYQQLANQVASNFEQLDGLLHNAVEQMALDTAGLDS